MVKRRFATTHIELIAEISIGAGIHPIKATKNANLLNSHGEGATKSGAATPWIPLRIKAITTALTVVTVKAIMMIFDKLSNRRYFPNNKMPVVTRITNELNTGIGSGIGVINVKIAAVNNPTAAVLITVAKMFKARNNQR